MKSLNPPPHNPEAEQAVLGAILVKPEVLKQIGLQPEDFYADSHSAIYKAIMDLSGRGEPVDLVTVTQRLKAKNQLDKVGGPGFLAALSEEVGFIANAGYYARKVKETSIIRKLGERAAEIWHQCQKPIDSLEDLLTYAESQVHEVSQLFSGNGFKKFTDLETAIPEIGGFLQADIPERKIFFNPWFKEASLNMIQAWRGVGKSGFAMGLLTALANGEPFGPWECITPVPCLYLDAEMTQQDTTERFQSLHPGKESQQPLYIYSDHYCSLLGMPGANLLDEKWREWIKDEVLIKRGVKAWVIDNIGAITPGIDENSREAWSPINRWLLDLRFCGISTILIHHEGKSGGQRGTSAREDNLDITISLKRPKEYMPEDGARFICHFEKARIRQQNLHKIADTEFQMETDPKGKTVWTWANVKQENKARVLKMLDEGVSRKEIAAALGITGPRVSQIKVEAVKAGQMTEAGKLTQTGYLQLFQGTN